MAKQRKAVKGRGRARNRVGRHQSMIQRYARRVAIWRIVHDGDSKPVQDNPVFRGFVPITHRHEAFVQAQLSTFRWTCISITYYRDDWGNTYKRLGESRTSPLKAETDGIRPTIQAAFDAGEADGNSKQIYARGCVFAPISDEFPTLYNVIDSLRTELNLDDNDMQRIAEMEHDQIVDTLEYDPKTVHDLDCQIARLI